MSKEKKHPFYVRRVRIPVETLDIVRLKVRSLKSSGDGASNIQYISTELIDKSVPKKFYEEDFKNTSQTLVVLTPDFQKWAREQLAILKHPKLSEERFILSIILEQIKKTK
jgi:hypothetical protein